MTEATSDDSEEVGRAEAPAPAQFAAATPQPASRQSVGRWMWEWTKSIFVALMLFLFVRTFMIEAFQIPTGSMENTLLVGDFLLVNKMAYGAEIPGTDITLPAFGNPHRGDVVVFEPPPSAAQPPRTNYVKRIVGAPGDTLEMRRAKLLVNGTPIDEPYLKGAPSRDTPSAHFSWQGKYLVDAARRRRYRPTRDNWGPLVVPAENYFVMGDNRSNSEDSRYWGFVPTDAIKGRPIVVYYSYDRKRQGSATWLTDIRWDRILQGVR